MPNEEIDSLVVGGKKNRPRSTRRSQNERSFHNSTGSLFHNNDHDNHDEDVDFSNIIRGNIAGSSNERSSSRRGSESRRSNKGNGHSGSSSSSKSSSRRSSTASPSTSNSNNNNGSPWKHQMSQSMSRLMEDESATNFHHHNDNTLDLLGDKMNLSFRTSTTPTTRASVSPSFYSDSHNSNNSNNNHNNVASNSNINSNNYLSDVLEDRGHSYLLPMTPLGKEHEEHSALLISSDMADPLDPLAATATSAARDHEMENFHDEFDQEMDEIEMRDERNKNFIRLSELEAKANAGKIRRRSPFWMCCYCCSCCFPISRRCRYILCLVMVAIVVGGIVAGVTMAKKLPTKIVKIPQDVPKIESRVVGLYCHEGLDLGPGQHATFPLLPSEDCKNVCNKAECCWNPNGNYECTIATRDNCLAYKADCSIMIPHSTSDDYNNDAVAVPRAPSTLKTTCVPIGPSFTATTVCYNLCSAADCCWNATSATPCTTSANCQPYQEFCSFFNEHPPATTTTTTTTVSPSTLPFPAATSDLASYCDVVAMEEIGKDKCQQHCSAAACCWKVGTVNCASTVPDNMCQPYAQACAVLNALDAVQSSGNSNYATTTTAPAPQSAAPQYTTPAPTPPATTAATIPPAPNGLNAYCDPGEMETISLRLCEEKCGPAECCWSTKSGSCPTSIPAETCQPYVQACAILNDLMTYPGDGGNGNGNTNQANADDVIPQAPGDLATRCSEDNISGASDGGSILIQCERECLEAACCWQPGTESCTTNQRCLDYKEPCSIFVGLFSGNGGNGGNTAADVGSSGSDQSSASTSSPLTEEAKAIEDACNNKVAFFVKTRCESACRPGSCCYDDSMACSAGVDCLLYEPCSVLHRIRHNLRR